MENRLLLDMDGVMCDTMGAVFNEVRTNHGIDIVHADITDYWFKDSPASVDCFMDALRTKGIYRNLDVITGAVGAVNRLREQFDVVVCTAPMKGAEFCEDEKREWLAEHFDQDFAERAIVTADKSKVIGRLLIEDNPHVESPAQVIMFDQAYNRDRTDVPRMYGWHDLKVIQEAMEWTK